jgi:hypothetical protein
MEPGMTALAPSVDLATDTLVIGSGAAGMAAALAAEDQGALVILVDRSLIGRSGATIMAPMKVAVALGEEVDNHLYPRARDRLQDRLRPHRPAGSAGHDPRPPAQRGASARPRSRNHPAGQTPGSRHRALEQYPFGSLHLNGKFAFLIKNLEHFGDSIITEML